MPGSTNPPYTNIGRSGINEDESYIRYLTNYIEEITTERDELKTSLKIALKELRFSAQQQVTANIREIEFEKALVLKDAENKDLYQRIHSLSERIKEYQKKIEILEEENQLTGELEGEINFQTIIINVLKAQLKNAHSDLEGLQVLFEEATLQLSKIGDADIIRRITGRLEENESHINQLDNYMDEIDALDEEDEIRTNTDEILDDSPIMPEKPCLAQELEEAGGYPPSPNSDRLKKYNVMAFQDFTDYIVQNSEQYPAILVSFLLQIVWKQLEDTVTLQYETEFYNGDPTPLLKSLSVSLSPDAERQYLVPKKWIENSPDADPSEVASVSSLYHPLDLRKNQSFHPTPNITIKKSTHKDYSFHINPTESPSSFFHPFTSEKKLPHAQVIAHMLIALAYHQHNIILLERKVGSSLKVSINETHPCAQELVDFLCAYQSLSMSLGKPIPLSILNFSNHTNLSNTNPDKIEKLLVQLLPDTIQGMLPSQPAHSLLFAS